MSHVNFNNIKATIILNRCQVNWPKFAILQHRLSILSYTLKLGAKGKPEPH